MSRKTSLSTQTSKLNIVIRKNRAIDKQKIIDFCNIHFVEWAFIEHKGDIEPITAEVEGIHYHIVANAKEKRVRLQTWLNNIVDFFHFKNGDGVCVDKYQSYEGSLQYLIHKNDKLKTQHSIDEIVTNIDYDDLKILIQSEYDSMTFARIEAMCRTYNSLIEIYRNIPFDWCYQTGKRTLIKEVFEYYHRLDY